MSVEALGARNPAEVKVSSLNDLFIPNASISTNVDPSDTCMSVSSALCDPLWLQGPGVVVVVDVHITRSTQPCIPPGSLNRVPASAGVKAGMSPLPGGR